MSLFFPVVLIVEKKGLDEHKSVDVIAKLATTVFPVVGCNQLARRGMQTIRSCKLV
jgi:hypothetical protein